MFLNFSYDIKYIITKTMINGVVIYDYKNNNYNDHGYTYTKNFLIFYSDTLFRFKKCMLEKNCVSKKYIFLYFR